MNIQEIRQKYPQYSDMTDQQIADGMYKKYYSDMSREAFDQKIGFSAQPVEKNLNNDLYKFKSREDLINEGSYPLVDLVPDALTGIAKGMRNLVGLIPGANNVIPKTQNVSDIVGLSPKTGDAANAGNLVQEAASFAPTALTAEIAIPSRLIQAGQGVVPFLAQNAAKSAAEGSFYSQSIGEDPVLGAALGLTPYAGMAAGRALESAGEKIARPFKQSILDSIAPTVLQKEFSMTDAPENIMKNYESLLRSNHDYQMGIYNKLREEGEGFAKWLDNSADPVAFDSTKYNESLSALKKTLNPKYRIEEIAAIDDLLSKAPKNYTDAMELRKYINSELPLDSVSKAARQGLIKSVEDSARGASNPIASDFLNSWQKANEQYAKNVTPFYKVPAREGVLKPNKNLKKALQSDDYMDAGGNLIDKYVTKGTDSSALGYDYLSRLIGQDAAKDAVRAGYFRDAYTKNPELGEVPINTTFLNKFNKASPTLKSAMFSPEEEMLLEHLYANKRARIDSGGTIAEGIGSKITGAGAGALAGETLAFLFGLPHGYSALAGSAAGSYLGRRIWNSLVGKKANKDDFLKLSKELQKGAKKPDKK